MSLFTSFRVWHMLNQDTLQGLTGQFEAENLQENIGSAYIERWTLNRKKAILQFLHGVTPTITFQGRLYNETVMGPRIAGIPILSDVRHDLQTLKEWSQRDALFGRPPIITFWVGDSFLSMDCVIESLTPTYDKPGALGRFKGATFQVTLREYTPYDIKQVANFDTRYARVKYFDYYELMAAREYRRPMLGVFLRQGNPDKVNLQAGDVLRLPAANGPTLRTAIIEPRSIIFTGAFGRKNTATKARRLATLNKRRRGRVSHILGA